MDSIVLVTDRPEEVAGQLPDGIRMQIVCREADLEKFRSILAPGFPNATFIDFKNLEEDSLRDKLFVVYGGVAVSRPVLLFRGTRLARLLDAAALGVISMPAGKLRRLASLSKYLGRRKYAISGRAKTYADSPKKDWSVYIGGRLINVRPGSYPTVSALAIMHVYNERDIIRATVRHLLDQGVDVHVIDNWSDDGTHEIVKEMAAGEPRITYERFPATRNNKFELEKMLLRVEQVAKSKRQYDWVFLNDADEIRWSPWKGVSLREAFSFIDSVGYNAVDFTVFNFMPTKEGYEKSGDPLTFFEYGEFGTLSGYFVQVKAWRNHPDATLAASGGHHISFPGLKIYPLKFLLGHYPIRSTKHGRDKIFNQRMPRYAAAERKRGWHVQYDDINKKTGFLRRPEDLVRFNQESFYRDYLLERISGIGIDKESG